MRVVAGELRGRTIETPAGNAVRPTTDKVRQAVGNALVSLGVVEGAHVLDLFAGSGALGIEALSRGAATVTFVERDAATAALVRRNLAALGVADRATVVRADALVWLARRAADSRFDVAFCDPPYAFEDWTALLEALPAAVVVAESDRAVPLPSSWSEVRVRRYGSTVVTIAVRPEDRE